MFCSVRFQRSNWEENLFLQEFNVALEPDMCDLTVLLRGVLMLQSEQEQIVVQVFSLLH